MDLNRLLGEHVYLAAREAGAALRGQGAAFGSATCVPDANSIGISKAIGAAHGEDTLGVVPKGLR